MKIRRSVYLVCGLAIILLALLVWLTARPRRTAQLVTIVPQLTNSSAAANAHQQSPSAQVSQNNAITTPPPSTVPAPREGKEQQMLEILSTENDVPIIFYGKLEDQFGNSVADADIKGSVIINNGITEGHAQFTTTSDTEGFFKLDAGKGESLGIMPRKPGYALASLNGGGFYTHLKPEEERQHPDPDNPVVIKMWKLQGAEPLLKINQRYKVPFTSMPINIDLLAGKVVPSGGDIQLIVSRSSGIVSERTLQDWSVKIGAVDGGLMDSAGQDRVTYWAPESGYLASEDFVFSTTFPYKWSGGFTHDFFTDSRNGEIYSKLRISFSINQDPNEPMDISFSGIANTNWSRNWEGDADTYKP